ncbi:Ger(x)C family spore germination protein [Paenibacillus lignilyticus]|uniref:Ger(X)C family spore germination protein n=1 Tax=Paenibacillus lignilyticus TaxID=1172615 RepID=A0ABS5CBI8_9BACL|nr:Ger(x)C family spore germination protein [Paenibacillus lignilyticus]MBP3963195.1 Ger(x)C family spore germination protein [Paenibacillus lignilyticus]
MPNKAIMLITTCCLAALLTGCEESNIIEKLAVLEAGAYDLSERSENPITTTVLFPTVTREGKFDTMTLTANGKSIHDTFVKVQNLTSLKIVGGQGTILFGEELSKKGLFHVIQSLRRDPEIGTRVKFAIVEGHAGKILEKKFPSIEDNAEFIYKFLDRAGKHTKVLFTNQYRFIRDYYDDGIDPVLPVFSYEGEAIGLKGLGTFKGDQYVTLLTINETQMLNYLIGDIRNGSLMITMNDLKSGENIQLSLSNINSKNGKRIDTTNMNVEVILRLKGSVLEYTGTKDISNEKYQRELEGEIEEYVRSNSEKLIAKLQKYQSDPIGIGKVVRNRLTYEKWKKMNWTMIYPNLSIHVKVKVGLTNTGKSK